jgi:DNA polymerase-3 subunit chi
MPQVEFHILSELGDDARLRHACRLVEQAYDDGQRVLVCVAAEADAHRLDEMLWTFRDQAFIPHEIVAANSASHPRIMALITADAAAPTEFHAQLISLRNELPAALADFQRIIEIVDADPQRKQQARERYKHYREQGCSLETKNV